MRPVREFQRRVRLALEENHMLPGDPNRVFNSFCRQSWEGRPQRGANRCDGTDSSAAARSNDDQGARRAIHSVENTS